MHTKRWANFGLFWLGVGLAAGTLIAGGAIYVAAVRHQEIISWFRDNKDAALAMGAFAGPVVAGVAAILSFTAITTAPRVQREIARDTIRMTRAQITASLYGTADHQWITVFLQTIAEMISIGAEYLDTSEKDPFTPDALRAIEERVAKIQLLVSSLEGAELRGLVHRLLMLSVSPEGETERDYNARRTDRGRVREEIVEKAREVIQRREGRLATYASGEAITR
jgi:hypothetical protein